MIGQADTLQDHRHYRNGKHYNEAVLIYQSAGSISMPSGSSGYEVYSWGGEVADGRPGTETKPTNITCTSWLRRA